jgi:methyl-accepting chemotaxis protein
MHKRKKLNLSIKRDIQVWILRKMSLAIIIAIAVAMSIVYLYSHKELGDSFYSAHLRIRHVSDLLLPVVLSAGGVCLLVGGLFAIFFPQEIVGPVYRIEEDLKKVARGNFEQIFRFRDTDRFHSLTDAANMAVGRAREELKAIDSGLKILKTAISAGETEKAEKATNELQERLSKLKF